MSLMKSHLTLLFTTLATTLATTLLSQPTVFGLENQMVKMRDGVELATDIHLPKGEGPWPCVLARTPYNKRRLQGQAKDFVEAGYAYIAQDCRGKFRSKGKYNPFLTDHHDGHDAVEWVAAQDWSNGRVGMAGASALGVTSNLAATQRPPHLVCAFVAVAGSSARRVTVYNGGVYRKELNDGWLTAQGAKFAIDMTMENPPGNDFWDWREIGDFYEKIDIPIFNVGGWYDIFAQGTIDNFVGIQSRGRGLAAGNQRVVMGPWAHGLMGGRSKYPEANPGEYLSTKLQIRWFDRWLKNERNGTDREPRVTYYVMGALESPGAPGNEWREAPSWPPISRPRSLFLHPKLALADSPPSSASADAETTSITYEYDPKNTARTIGGHNLIQGGRGPLDQRKVGKRDDYFRFRTEPLEHALEIGGRVSCQLFVESDAPDTDFVAKLVDVYPDGYEALVLDGIIRARYREGLEREVFLEKGKVVPVTIDLWSTAYAFNKGHRIALHVTSSNDPKYDPNPNTGKPQRSDDETRIATNRVHFSEKYPSRILLPVVKDHRTAEPVKGAPK